MATVAGSRRPGWFPGVHWQICYSARQKESSSWVSKMRARHSVSKQYNLHCLPIRGDGYNIEEPKVTRKNRSKVIHKKSEKRKKPKFNSRMVVARSMPCVQKGKQKIKVLRGALPVPAFFISAIEGQTMLRAKEEIWKKISTPMMQAITTKSGKIVLKPQDKKITGILRITIGIGNYSRGTRADEPQNHTPQREIAYSPECDRGWYLHPEPAYTYTARCFQ